MHRYASGRIDINVDDNLQLPVDAKPGDGSVRSVLRESSIITSYGDPQELEGLYDGRQASTRVPSLTANDSKKMITKMAKVIKPFEFEDLRRPTKAEMWQFVKRRIPFITWVPLTTWDTLKADLVSGFTIMVMVIPQGMSYADIAGLPLVYGLYATMVPCFVYAATGNSRQLAVGPTALVAILTNTALEGLLTEEECPEFFNGTGSETQAETCPEQYASLAAVCAFIVGIIQIGAAFAQLGFIVQFLGHPVVSGFTSAAAFLIALTQVRNIFGFSIRRSQFIYVTIGI